ncbi:hypothetical protein LguiA_017754 [Lonicera macranthoides]
MTRQLQPLLEESSIVFRGSPDRRQSLLTSQELSSRGGPRFAEVAGGTTAECAAVCCCCPCGLASFAYLAVYKLPAGLCKKALRKKRHRRLMKKRLLASGGTHHARCQCGCDDTELQFHSVSGADADLLVKSLELDEDVMELEKEMWDKFYTTGFWRSPSRRGDKPYDSD